MTVTINPSPGDKVGLKIVQTAGQDDGGALGGCFIKLVRPDTPASRAGNLTTGMRLLSLGGVDASMQSLTEILTYLKQAGTAGGPFEMVAIYDPKGYAAYDGGTLFNTKQAHTGTRVPEAQMMEAVPLEPTQGNDHARLLAEEQAWSTHALELAASGRHAEALQVYQQSLEIKMATVGPNHATVGPLHSKMASTYKTLGKLADALVSYEKALAVATIIFGTGHKNVGE